MGEARKLTEEERRQKNQGIYDLYNENVSLKQELERVRGLLQRQWVSVEERLPEGINEFWCWVVARPEEECMTDTSGKPISAMFRIKPHFDRVKTYHTLKGELRFNCGALEKVTHWMPLPIPPTFPQSSSLVPQGAESADIGKVDAADKSGKVNRVDKGDAK